MSDFNDGDGDNDAMAAMHQCWLDLEAQRIKESGIDQRRLRKIKRLILELDEALEQAGCMLITGQSPVVVVADVYLKATDSQGMRDSVIFSVPYANTFQAGDP